MGTVASSSLFGSAFDRVVVVNLDRRSDRMSTMRDQLEKLGIGYTRHAATDGRAPAVAQAWRAYSASAIVQPGDAGPPVENWRDFYLGEKSHAERVAFFERSTGRKAIASPGAWGLFQSMLEVLARADRDGVGSLLILEDDALFHRDCVDLWPRVMSELPEDWQILQLGAMQLHWEDDWISWLSPHLYRCGGSSIAAHAVALRREAIGAVLARMQVPDLPFDVGPLQEVKRTFRERSFTCYPNLVIQDAADSEIGMSKMFFAEAAKEENVYRWDWRDYGPSVLRPHHPATTRASAVNGKSEAREANDDPRTFLQPYSVRPGSADRVIVILAASEAAETERYLDMLAAQKEQGDIAPIVLVDDLTLAPALRLRELAFEYIPPEETYRAALPEDRDADLVVARRLSILRRKWLPTRIIALGARAHARLEAWRASPFEATEAGADLSPEPDALRGVME